ncbi:hypothetical protein F5Y19DRAFT_484755 [Xylariaceae sp. FL1651]|nr:hypothetical protein F5Y19DRAFT_484755 [Xylariaceae sp. FL1651]
MGNFASPHKLLLVSTDVSESRDELDAKFEGTIPLEWAIEYTPFHIAEAMLIYGLDDLIPLDDGYDEDEGPQEIVLLCYAQAAYRRQKPAMLALMIRSGLDPDICDTHGNSMLHMICTTVETIWPHDDPEFTPLILAERAAHSIIVLLESNVSPDKKNRNGTSALDHIRRFATYTGLCIFRQQLAQTLNQRLIMDEVKVRVRFDRLDSSE